MFKQKCLGEIPRIAPNCQREFATLQSKTVRIVAAIQYKNSSGDEIANVNFLRRYGTYVLQNTKKENLLRLTN